MFTKLGSRRPSTASVLAVLALMVALGGTAAGEPVVTAAKKLVTGKGIKNNSVTSADIRNGSLRARDFRPGQLPGGPQGPTGPAGPKGDTGSVDTSNFFTKAESDARFLGADAKASDADRLDGLDSADIARTSVFFGNAGGSAFTVPEGVTSVLLEIRGAGGGGNFFNAGGSGGQGGLVRAWVTVQAGDVLNVTVGEGGFGGNGVQQNGNAGGASSVARSGVTLASAAGGAGGALNAGGAGGGGSVSAPAVGVARAVGATGATGTNETQAAGGGPPGFFGSGDDSGASPTGFQGMRGYVLLTLNR